MHHLKQGDLEPKVSPEKFTLYDFKFCPYCQRVRYTLDYHQIPYDRVMVNLISKPDWYYRLHPDGKVPLLRFQDERLIESDLVMLYVDQFNGKPETSLLNVCGEEAFKEALALSAAFIRPRLKITYSDDASSADVESFVAACHNIEDALKGPYLCGENLSLADMALAPFLNAWEFTMNRLEALKPGSKIRESLAASCPKLETYRTLMAGKSFAKATSYTDEEYAKFVEIYKAKDTNAIF
uniref:Glutathione transferase n=1 Tax=Mesocestoides corti TaxID=53468 RepID=A0A5K3EX39_MESCO